MKTIERSQIIVSSTLFLLLILITLMLSTTGCIRERIEGNYSVGTEERSVSSFYNVESNGNIHVEIIPSDETRVEVKAETNVIPYVETWSDGNTMIVEFRHGYNIHEHYPVEVTLYTPELESLHLSGSGRIYSGHFNAVNASVRLSGSGNIDCSFNAATLDADVSGSGNLFVEGAADRADLRISGSGKIDAGNLACQTCKAKISGSGNLWVDVEESLEGWISGSGSIYYYGDPVVISHISGSGRINRY